MTDTDPVSFEGRVAIITGAGGGLGRAYARLLASRGARVVVADTNSVVTPEGGQAIARTALDAFGRIDVVINNAGILRDRTFAKITTEEIDAVLDVHLRGAFNVTRPAWEPMREQGYGRILNIVSNSGILGTFGQTNYGAAKMGLVGLTRVLAVEGAKHGIHVNALAPIARTRMTEEVLGPIVTRLHPDLVAPVAAWLVHEDCPATGEIYSAAGGRVARFFIGLTRGIVASDLTIEDVRGLFDRIRDVRDFEEHASAPDEIDELRQMLEVDE